MGDLNGRNKLLKKNREKQKEDARVRREEMAKKDLPDADKDSYLSPPPSLRHEREDSNAQTPPDKTDSSESEDDENWLPVSRASSPTKGVATARSISSTRIDSDALQSKSGKSTALNNEVEKLKVIDAATPLAAAGPSAVQAAANGVQEVNGHSNEIALRAEPTAAAAAAVSAASMELFRDWTKSRLKDASQKPEEKELIHQPATEGNGVINGNIVHISSKIKENIGIAYNKIGNQLVSAKYYRNAAGEFTAIAFIRDALDIEDLITDGGLMAGAAGNITFFKPPHGTPCTRPVLKTTLFMNNLPPFILSNEKLIDVLLEIFAIRGWRVLNGTLKVYCKDTLTADALAEAYDGFVLCGAIVRVEWE